MSPTSVGPRFTVVLNTYNRAAVVSRAIDSVLAQTLDDFELVVVDDGSVDDTRAVVTAHRDRRVRYVYRGNGGLAAARNTGLHEARGQFVAFMDDDDVVAPTWLERMAEAIDRDGAAVVSCGTEIRSLHCPGSVMRAARRETAKVRLPAALGAAFEHQVGLFLPGTFAVRRDVLVAIGGYVESLRCSEQTELSLRFVPYCVSRHLPVAAVQEALVVTNRESDERRPLRRADWLHDGSVFVLERHGERLRRSPRAFAGFCAVAAVQGARMGRFAVTRTLLLDAIRARPTDPKHYARLFLAMCPPLARRVWGTWTPPRQLATAERTAAARRRAVLRRLPIVGSRRLGASRPEWPPVRQPVAPPPRQEGWVSGPPDFVGIGAQRGGTSWWYSLVSEHPSVHVNPSVPKEVHFFDRFDEHGWGVDAQRRYHDLFPRPQGCLTGEWTPEYMVWPWCPPRLKECGVDKLLVVLRDPVERFWAGWSFSLRRGAPAVPTIAGDAFHRGLYHRQLSWVLEYFDRSQLLVLQYEQCLVDPHGQIRRTYEFLGVDPTYVPSAPAALVKAVHPKSTLDPGVRRVVSDAYRADVEALATTFPEIDLDLWPHAAHWNVPT